MNIILSQVDHVKHFEYTTSKGDGAEMLLELIDSYQNELNGHPPGKFRFEMSHINSYVLGHGRHYEATLAVYKI